MILGCETNWKEKNLKPNDVLNSGLVLEPMVNGDSLVYILNNSVFSLYGTVVWEQKVFPTYLRI